MPPFLIMLTDGCHHYYGAFEVIIGWHVETMVFVANKRPSSHLVPGYIHYISIHGAHQYNRYDYSQHHEEHVEGNAGWFEAGNAEELCLAVDVTTKTEEWQSCVEDAVDPHHREDDFGPVRCKDHRVAEGEADLCELVDSGPGEGMDGGELEQQKQKGAALAGGALAGVALHLEKTVMDTKRNGGDAQRQIT